MKKTFLCLYLLTIAVIQAQESAEAAFTPLQTYIEEQTTGQMKTSHVPGLAVAVIDNGHVIYKKGLGYADVKNQLAMQTHTGFNIGSISKMFTAWGVMKLVEDGKVNLDDPVEKHLTRWKLPKSEYDHNKITIRSLLSHTGGISVHGYPGFPPELELPTLEASLDGENGPVRDNAKVEVIHEPLTKFKYSGGGYTLLQLLIEEVTKTSFESYMETTIFKPLKMRHTSFTINETILKHSAKPYDTSGTEVPIERFTAKAAAGLHTTLEDLLLFAKASFDGNSILKPETIKLMTTMNPITKSKRGGYGLGYMTYIFGPMAVTGHAGSNTGWESGFMMDFKTKSGVIILTNGDNGKNVAINLLRQWVKWKMSQNQKK